MIFDQDELIFNNFIETPFNYTGSKYKILPQILKYFDYTKNNFVDLFSGGGSVYTNILERYKNVYVNDIIKDLIETHKYLIFDTENSIKIIKKFVVEKNDKNGYLELRESYNNDPTPLKLYSLMLCCTNNMMRFNKKFKFNQTFGKRTFNENTKKKIISFSDHVLKFKDKLNFSSFSFNNFPIIKDSFVYMDPPYSNTEAGYNSYWEKDDDLLLFNYCNKLHENGVSFAVSGVEKEGSKECRLLKLLKNEEYIKQYEIIFNYNKVSRSGNKKFKEILLVNF